MGTLSIKPHPPQKMAKLQYDFTRLSICLSTILEFHNKWLLFLGNYCICVIKISSRCYKSLQMLRSIGNRHTDTHKLTTLGLIIINRVRYITSSSSCLTLLQFPLIAATCNGVSPFSFFLLIYY